ncbi:hypothetical protein SSS_04726 [Sarcoptes scabiei]|nr:hypothetical protein SSS_04726 [Sarcoptes scabiei]
MIIIPIPQELRWPHILMLMHFLNLEGGHAIMNMCIIPTVSKYSFDLPCGGMEGMCYVYNVQFCFKNSSQFTRPFERQISQEDSGTASNLRRRHFSISSQKQSIDEENLSLNECDNDEDDEKYQSKELNENSDESEQNCKNETKPSNMSNILDYQFDFDLKESFQTDFHQKEPYQKLIKYSEKAQIIFSAGADGRIGFWEYPTYKLLARIKAHSNEIDDIDIHPSGEHIVSVSRDGRSLVWNVHNGSSFTELNNLRYLSKLSSSKKSSLFENAKYNPRLCRYTMIENDANNVRLFIALNTRSKLDSFICKWYHDCRNDQYSMEQIVSVGEIPLFAMAISDNGRFLAVGKQTGDVDVYLTSSLQRCYQLQQAHNIFVTAIEFLPSLPSTTELVGGQIDAALISVSVDNRIVLHKIPHKDTLGFFGSFTFFILFIVSVYLFMSLL